MIQVGKPPYLECSSRGDKRFSAFYAKVGGKPIEHIYQAAKKFKVQGVIVSGLPWKKAKKLGKPINIDELAVLYKDLWRTYLLNNPSYINILKKASGLSDIFGQENHNCQAITLWELRSEL